MTRKSSGVDVQHAIPIAIGLACGIYAFSVGVPRLVTQLTGVEGSFHAERCTWELDSEGETQGECEGSFTASDGSFTIRPIESEGVFHSRPQEPVPRLVGGPSADKAVPPDLATSLVPMGFGLTASAFPAWALTAATRDAAERRRRRRAWPAAADLPPNFGPVRIPPAGSGTETGAGSSADTAAGSGAGSSAAVGSVPPVGTTPKHHS
ncbi:hypothetical protein GT352_09675 [Streptomyces sp. SID1046]|uniref:hypothetical protein n=1 Tax=Streptomyces sp. SID1046 TaxID=2690249 RepID=UPI00136D8034|nr:hypothetical protein [Streptomyces sp. SID1046]MYV74207.1 hypothetical protein [Streptomyces sp. SID1046]